MEFRISGLPKQLGFVDTCFSLTPQMMKNVAMSFLPHINYGWRDIARDIGLTWFSATLIAAISAMVMGDWERHLVISNLTGSLAYVLGLMGVRFFQPSLNQLSWLFVGSAAASALIGSLLGTQIFDNFFSVATNFWMALISVTIWVSVSLLFYASIRARVMESAFRREQLQNA